MPGADLTWLQLESAPGIRIFGASAAQKSLKKLAARNTAAYALFFDEIVSANALLSDAFIVVNPLLSDAFIVVNALFSDDAIPLMLWKAVMSNLSHLPDRTTWLGFDHTLLPF